LKPPIYLKKLKCVTYHAIYDAKVIPISKIIIIIVLHNLIFRGQGKFPNLVTKYVIFMALCVMGRCVNTGNRKGRWKRGKTNRKLMPYDKETEARILKVVSS